MNPDHDYSTSRWDTNVTSEDAGGENRRESILSDASSLTADEEISNRDMPIEQGIPRNMQLSYSRDDFNINTDRTIPELSSSDEHQIYEQSSAQDAQNEYTSEKDSRQRETKDGISNLKVDNRLGRAVEQVGSGKWSNQEMSLKHKIRHNFGVDDPLKPSSFYTLKVQKRIPGKYIDRFWEPLSQASLNSVEHILAISINKTIEKKRVSGKGTDDIRKLQEAQLILANGWSSSHNSNSFLSKLRVTGIPPPSTMLDSSRQDTEDFDILNYDRLTRHINFLQTYLLAEYRQLFELEKYHNDLASSYNMDYQYLNDFQKFTEENEQRMMRQNMKRFDLFKKSSKNSIGKTEVKNTPTNNSSFLPDTDGDTKAFLSLLHNCLDENLSKNKRFVDFNSKLENFLNSLDTNETS